LSFRQIRVTYRVIKSSGVTKWCSDEEQLASNVVSQATLSPSCCL